MQAGVRDTVESKRDYHSRDYMSCLSNSYSIPAVVAMQVCRSIDSGLPFFARKKSVFLYVIIQYLYASSKFNFFNILKIVFIFIAAQTCLWLQQAGATL